MASQRDSRLKVSILLCAGHTPTEVAKLTGMARKTVYIVKKRMDNDETIERKEGSGKKSLINVNTLKNAIEEDPTKSMRSHAKDFSVSHTTVSKTVKKLGGKSLVRLERPLLTASMKVTHLQRCQGLLNNLKSAAPGRVIIFSDEKTFDVDPVYNRRNDRYISFGVIDEDQRTITTTKHPASAMALGFVASNGIAAPLIWFPGGYRLTAAAYIDVLKANLLPWVEANFPDGNFIFQQDGAPAHTAKVTQNFLASKIPFWDKSKWPPYSPDANPLDFAFWPHIQMKACGIRHPNVTAMKASVDQEWAAMDPAYIRNVCISFRKRLVAIISAKGGRIE